MSRIRATAGFALLWLTAVAAAAETPAAAPDAVRIHGAESPGDTRYDYHWELLRLALERTRGTHGDYSWASVDGLSHLRQVRSLQDGTISVMIQTASADLEKDFRPVRIPLDKGLLGYRVLLVRQADLPRFASVRTEADLRAFSVGQGQGWLDVAVWKHNRFRVVEGASYPGLFRMLDAGRFDFFSRGVTEVLEEKEKLCADLPGLTIEPTLCVYYPWPRYFYCADTPDGRRLAARIETGLASVMKDRAAFDPLFQKYFGDTLRRLDLPSRRLIRLTNPTLPPLTPLDRSELWYDPFTPDRGR